MLLDSSLPCSANHFAWNNPLMKRLALADLSLLNLDGESVPMTEIVKRTTLMIFLRHLA